MRKRRGKTETAPRVLIDPQTKKVYQLCFVCLPFYHYDDEKARLGCAFRTRIGICRDRRPLHSLCGIAVRTLHLKEIKNEDEQKGEDKIGT